MASSSGLTAKMALLAEEANHRGGRRRSYLPIYLSKLEHVCEGGREEGGREEGRDAPLSAAAIHVWMDAWQAGRPQPRLLQMRRGKGAGHGQWNKEEARGAPLSGPPSLTPSLPRMYALVLTGGSEGS